MKQMIFIIDDEPDILDLVSISLQKEHYNTNMFESGKDFLAALKANQPNLILLDLMLPDINGLEICKIMKANPSTKHIPIIVLTAKETETDKVLGLELGADDYITKPFSINELCARVKAVLRRSEKNESISNPLHTNSIKTYKDIITLNRNTYEVSIKGIPVTLTTTEFNILDKLLEHPSWVFSREDLLSHLWGDTKFVNDRTIDVHIKHLRDKLALAGDIIKNIRGIGYKLE